MDLIVCLRWTCLQQFWHLVAVEFVESGRRSESAGGLPQGVYGTGCMLGAERDVSPLASWSPEERQWLLMLLLQVSRTGQP